MRNAGIAVLVGSVAFSVVLLIVWVLGLVLGLTGGGLIHLLLVAVVLLAPVGVVAGIVLIIVGNSRERNRRY
ncbi:MAG TPA: hypothetical protein VJ866_07975 [Pyrinomonadaceae bacterium]|nr:hypothetical protein [Pyrinomonadaceae bacterium]